MLGIIGSMDMEIADITSAMTDVKKIPSGVLDFYKGKLCGKDTVVAKCGAGKVNAAICAQKMISEFGAQKIINTGVAGGITEGFKICDTVVALKTCQHDIDTTPVGDPLGLISGINIIYIDCDSELTKILEQTAEGNVHTGTVASGDIFVCDKQKGAEIAQQFGACACEMECCAVAQACYISGIPFAAIKTISDGGDDGANMSYEQFAKIAAKQAAEHIVRAAALID